jgi:hypothetical protein
VPVCLFFLFPEVAWDEGVSGAGELDAIQRELIEKNAKEDGSRKEGRDGSGAGQTQKLVQ